ncbi:MAG: hypothetical protein ABWZ78_13040 [Burkholderiaceae bacterium]
MRLGHGTLVAAAAMVAGVALAACSEKPQTAGGAIKSDRESYSGVGNSQFAARGWNAGDKAGWEQQLKARTINGQNDYVRIAN